MIISPFSLWTHTNENWEAWMLQMLWGHHSESCRRLIVILDQNDKYIWQKDYIQQQWERYLWTLTITVNCFCCLMIAHMIPYLALYASDLINLRYYLKCGCTKQYVYLIMSRPFYLYSGSSQIQTFTNDQVTILSVFITEWHIRAKCTLNLP